MSDGLYIGRIAQDIDTLMNLGIRISDLIRGWKEYGISYVDLTESVATAKIRQWEGARPPGWQEKYGWWTYQIELNPEANRVKEAREVNKFFGFSIRPKDFYRVLWWHEIGHTKPASGMDLAEYSALSKEQKLEAEKRAWEFALKMCGEVSADSPLNEGIEIIIEEVLKSMGDLKESWDGVQENEAPAHEPHS